MLLPLNMFIFSNYLYHSCAGILNLNGCHFKAAPSYAGSVWQDSEQVLWITLLLMLLTITCKEAKTLKTFTFILNHLCLYEVFFSFSFKVWQYFGVILMLVICSAGFCVCRLADVSQCLTLQGPPILSHPNSTSFSLFESPLSPLFIHSDTLFASASQSLSINKRDKLK